VILNLLEFIQDCIAIIQFLPIVSEDKLEEFKESLLEQMNECCPVIGMIMKV
jgi:hypothetical protein